MARLKGWGIVLTSGRGQAFRPAVGLTPTSIPRLSRSDVAVLVASVPLPRRLTLIVYLLLYICYSGARGGVVVKALRYKPAGRGLCSQWCHWNFSLT
jgi:hypothetical protein